MTLREIRELQETLDQAEKTVRETKVKLAVLTGDGVGMFGIRDPQFPCEAFNPGTPRGQCETDGHYLCDECTERDTCDTGCGERKSMCECAYCEVCEEKGTSCFCPPKEASSLGG